MEYKKLGIVLLVIVILLLGFTFYVNTSGLFNFLADPLVGEGLGTLCDNEESCKQFCQDNRGRCDNYCQENPANELCNLLFFGSKNLGDEKLLPKLNKAETIDDRPVLKNLGFDIGPSDKSTNLAGDLIFDKRVVYDDGRVANDKVFLDFGSKDKYRINDVGVIEYWFFVPIGANVKAPISGIVDVGFFEHTKDWGINFRAKENSKWIVSYEHVIDVNVNDGDIVQAGEIVAKAAPRIGDNVAMTELAVWTGGQDIYKYCPFDFLDNSLKDDYDRKLRELASDWEEFIGKDVYEQEKWASPGCLVDKIKEA